MDPKLKEILNKVRLSALDAGKAAGKFAGDVVEQAKLNIQIFDMNTDIEVSYKEIGKLVYAIHKGSEICPEAIESLIEVIDEKNNQIAQLREKLNSYKNASKICPVCGRTVADADAYCAGCGYKFTDDANDTAKASEDSENCCNCCDCSEEESENTKEDQTN